MRTVFIRRRVVRGHTGDSKCEALRFKLVLSRNQKASVAGTHRVGLKRWAVRSKTHPRIYRPS